MVAFSGRVIDPDTGPGEFTESNMNPGLNGRDMREAFAEDDYQVMIVANKYQTGFDQPLLVSMYVDKKLAGVAAVQTLSRLNRTHPGKDVTFVIDFVNKPEEILEAFTPYYKTAALSGVSDPNVIHDLQSKLDASLIYTAQEVDNLVNIYFKKPTQAAISKCLQPAQSRFRDGMKTAVAAKDQAEIDRLEAFKKDVTTFVRIYDFLSQIINYDDSELEKRSIFLKLLARLLKSSVELDEIDLSDVQLTHYHLRKKGEQTIPLTSADGKALDPAFGDLGTTNSPKTAEEALFSEIIQKVNKLFEGDQLTDADAVAVFNHVAGKMLESESLKEQAEANSEQQFGASPDFKKVLEEAVIACFENHQSMTKQILTNDRIRESFADLLLPYVYGKLSAGSIRPVR
jgi:type I restriction enzyme R subunit